MRKIVAIGTALVMVLTIFTAFSIPGIGAVIYVPGDYPTIQAAVENASAGDTIIVAPGTYDEQVIINKSLTIQGAGDSTVINPSSKDKLIHLYTLGTQTGAYWNGHKLASIICVEYVGTAGVTVKDLKVDGENVDNAPSGANYIVGISYGETAGTIEDVTVEDMDTTSESPRSYGMWLDAVDTTVSVEVKDSTVTYYNKNGINARGADLTVDVHDNTLTGPGAVGIQVPNGVLLIDDADGTVDYNIINDHEYTGATWEGCGVLLFKAANGVTIENNTVYDCDDGIGIHDSDSAIMKNNMLYDDWAGLLLENGASYNTFKYNIVSNCDYGIRFLGGNDQAGDGNYVLENTISDSSLMGLNISGGSDAIIQGNVITGSGEIDILIKNSNNTVVSDNVASGSEKAIEVKDSNNVEIEGNVASSATYGIYVSGWSNDTLITDNTIAANTEGVHLESMGTDITISYNVIDGNTDYCVRVESTDVVNINKNSISNTTFGVWLDDSDSICVTNNIVSLFSKRGISATDSGTVSAPVNVKWNFIASDGASTPPGEPTGEDRLDGIHYRRSKGTISDNIVEAMYYPGHLNWQSGLGIYVKECLDVDVLNNHVSDYQKCGIVSNLIPAGSGDPVLIEGNTVIGWGWNDSLAQNGIQVGFSADADVINNYVEGNWWIGGGDWSASGILLYVPADDILIDSNIVVDSQTGICIDSYDDIWNYYGWGGNYSDITRNRITNSSWGALLENTTGIVVSRNFITDGTPSPGFSDQDVDGVLAIDDTSSDINNNIIDSFYNGTKIDTSTETTLKSNIIKNNNNGVVVDDCTDVKVEKNTITGNSDAGVLSSGGNSGLIIRKNTIRNNGKGIVLGEDETVELNVISDNGEEGVMVSGDGNSVFRNTVRNNNDGIKVAGDSNSIGRNVANNNANIGIWVTGDYNMIKRNVALSNGVRDAKDDGVGNVWINNIFGSGP